MSFKLVSSGICPDSQKVIIYLQTSYSWNHTKCPMHQKMLRCTHSVDKHCSVKSKSLTVTGPSCPLPSIMKLEVLESITEGYLLSLLLTRKNWDWLVVRSILQIPVVCALWLSENKQKKKKRKETKHGKSRGCSLHVGAPLLGSYMLCSVSALHGKLC